MAAPRSKVHPSPIRSSPSKKDFSLHLQVPRELCQPRAKSNDIAKKCMKSRKGERGDHTKIGEGEWRKERNRSFVVGGVRAYSAGLIGAYFPSLLCTDHAAVWHFEPARHERRLLMMAAAASWVP